MATASTDTIAQTIQNLMEVSPLKLNPAEDEWLTAFYDDFLNKNGHYAFQNFKIQIGKNRLTALRTEIDKLSSEFKSYQPTIESERILLTKLMTIEPLKFDPNEDEWLETFYDSFETIGFGALDKFASNIGPKRLSKLKDYIKQIHPALETYIPEKKDSKSVARCFLTKLLTENPLKLNPLEDEWVNDLIMEFLEVSGFEALSKFSQILGKNRLAKLTDAAKQIEIIMKYKPEKSSNTIISSNDIEETKTDDTLMNFLTSPPFNFSSEFDEWLGDFVEDFEVNGLNSLEKFRAKIGKKKMPLLQEKLTSSTVLSNFKPKSKRAEDELKKLMENPPFNFDPENEEWLSQFYNDFIQKSGIKAINTYSTNIGKKKSSLLIEISNKSQVIATYKPLNPSIEDALLEFMTNPPANFDPEDHPWLADFMKDFVQHHGLQAFLFHEEKIGKKKTVTLIEMAKKNPRLASYLPIAPQVHFPKCDTTPKQKSKKIVTTIVLGVTGAGKSSVINFFYVWGQKIDKVENINEVLINTRFLTGIKDTNIVDSSKQHDSQTKNCSIYEFDLEHEFVTYQLRFMDTPGLGDTEGHKTDDLHMNLILDTIATTPELNSIIIMINGSEPRVSSRLSYCIQKIVGILPNVIEKNLIVLMSNVATLPNLDVRKIPGLPNNVPSEHIFFFDNPIFSIDVKNSTPELITQVNFLYQQAKAKMARLLHTASQMKTTNTDTFKELKEKRDQFRDEINLLQKNIQELQNQENEISHYISEVKNLTNKKNKLDLKLFTTSKKSITTAQDTDYYSTRCSLCESNCHKKCSIEETTLEGSEIFMNCYAFAGEKDCKLCQHSYLKHVHLRSIWVHTEKTEDIISPEIQLLINQTQDESTKKQKVIEALEKKKTDIQNIIHNHKTRIQTIVSGMKSICSQFNYEMEVQFTIEVLEEKKQAESSSEQKSLYETTIQMLKDMRRHLFG